MVEIVTKYQIISIDILFGREFEGYAVLVAVFGVWGEGEVGGC
jgi:hypothetical protein